MFRRRLIMQPDSRKEEQAAERREDVKERKHRFQIVKLEERIAPSTRYGHTYACRFTRPPGHCK
jgi:hypothetical protein